ncbi:MAG: amidohydrolase family protein [Candidatus Helarchaeota archaeon]
MPELTISCGLGLIGESLTIEKNVLLTIKDGIIRDIQVNLPKEKGQLHYPHYVLIPGFINTHTHIGDSFAKDQGLYCSIRELVEPPNGLKHQLLNKVSDEILFDGFRSAIKEMISTGTTTFVDFRESGVKGIQNLRKIVNETPINTIICGRPFPDLQTLPKVIELCDAIGLSSTNIYSKDELNYINQICKDKKKLILTHVAETLEERTFAIETFKRSDIERAINILDADILVHITHADEEDIQLIAKKQKSVVVCPRSNAHLGVGFPPLILLLKHNILTCLGTDNVMINNLNLFREMEFLFKSMREKWGVHSISPYEILRMVTINPAKALKVDKEFGSIDKGKRADFFLIDLDAPNIQHSNSIYNALVLRANPSNIGAVFIGGKQIYDT